MLKAKNNFKEEKPLNGLEPFVSDFCKDRITEVEYLITQAKQNKFSEISNLSHKWKGYSSPYGFQHLETLAIELHLKSEIQDYNSCIKLIDQTYEYLKLKKLLIGDNFDTNQRS